MRTRPKPQRGVHLPRQARSRATLEQLLDAAETLIEETGFDNVTVQDVVDAAGSSVGAFYKRFHGKDGLLDALFDRLEQKSTARQLALARRAGDLTPQATIHAMVAEVVDIYTEHGQLIRAMMQRATLHTNYQERAATMFRAVSTAAATVLGTKVGRGGRSWERAVDFSVYQLFALVDMRVTFGDIVPTRFALSDRALIRAAADTMIRSLGLEAEA